MSFFSIVPRTESYLKYNVDSIPLQIIREGKGVDVTPGFGVNVTDLNNGYKQFTKTSESGNKFKVNVLFKKDDKKIATLNGKKLNTREVMDHIIRNMIPVMIQTEAIDVPTDVNYLITGNPSRNQNYKDDTVWELEFTTYIPLNLIKFANDNKAILNAINKSKKKNSKSTKKSSVKYQKLKDCGYKNLKYSKNKKVVKCVKVLQEVLYKNKCFTSKKQIDGWFGKKTVTAVKLYQKRYNKKYKVTNKAQKNSGGIFQVSAGTLISGKVNKTTVNKKAAKISKKLPTNGKVDKATWIALYKGE